MTYYISSVLWILTSDILKSDRNYLPAEHFVPITNFR